MTIREIINKSAKERLAEYEKQVDVEYPFADPDGNFQNYITIDDADATIESVWNIDIDWEHMSEDDSFAYWKLRSEFLDWFNEKAEKAQEQHEADMRSSQEMLEDRAISDNE